MGVVPEISAILVAGRKVRGTIELPDYLVYWQLSWEKDSLVMRVIGHVDLDGQIELTPQGEAECSADDFPPG